MSEVTDIIGRAEPMTIVTYPDPVLLKKAAPIEVITPAIRELAERMVATLMASSIGVGLAAPQVGESVRMVIIDLSYDPEEGNADGGLYVLVNPEIVQSEGVYEDDEGCLSLPGLTYPVERPERVVVEFSDLNGQMQQLQVTEFNAKLVCHEIDHLDGVLLWDRLSKFKRDWLKAKYKKALKPKEPKD
jgi:peptide deformylase